MVTFAAPVYLNGEIGNVGVCVQYGKGNIHSVRFLTPMGETFELLKTKDTETTITGRSSRATVDPYIVSVSNNNIHEIKSESNTKFSDKDAEMTANGALKSAIKTADLRMST